MEKVVLTANTRTVINKTSRSTIRKNGRVPGIFYSRHNKPIAIDVLEKSIKPLVFTASTNLISLKVDDKEEYECVIKDVQFDPVTEKIVHIDLLGLTKDETFQLEVPILFIGSPVGIKEGGILQQVLHKLQIECLPKDIPQHLDINIENLKLGESIHISDLNYENIKLLNPADAVVAAVTHPKVEKVATEGEGAETTAEPEVINKGKADKEEE
jgi:large subunit ribosomal protein L25